MNQSPHTFVTSPPWRMRACGAAMMLGIPAFLVAVFLSQSQGGQLEWHVTGVARWVAEIVFLLMFGVAIVAGLYIGLFRIIVTVDPDSRRISRETNLCGVKIRRRVWTTSDFQRIELRHHASSGDPGDNYQTDVWLRHLSGSAIFIRVFWSPRDRPSQEAVAFAGELGKSIGLPCEGQKA